MVDSVKYFWKQVHANFYTSKNNVCKGLFHHCQARAGYCLTFVVFLVLPVWGYKHTVSKKRKSNLICMNINSFGPPHPHIHPTKCSWIYVEYMKFKNWMKNIFSISVNSIQNKLASLSDFFQLYWDIIDIYQWISSSSTTWGFDTYIHCKMIATRLVNTSITSHKYNLLCVVRTYKSSRLLLA